MATNLHQFAKKNGVKYFFVSFVDLFGVLRSKLVPATAIDEIQSEGAGFAGFATWLDMSPADSDMFGIPDGDKMTLIGAIASGELSKDALSRINSNYASKGIKFRW